MAINLGFARVAANGEHPPESGVISIVEKRPDSPVGYQYLICSRRERSASDLITIHEFAPSSDWPDVHSLRGMGLQITVSDARGDARHAAEWIAFARRLAKQCKLSGSQFILSSGAESVLELVPGPALDAILKLCGIDPLSHWQELNFWLDSKLAARVTI